MIRYHIIILIMALLYKPPFRKFVKKQNRPFQLAIEDEVERINQDHAVGEVKKGDLSGFRVYKFKVKGMEYLIAYKAQDKDIVFYMIDTHENFYNALKRYIREVE